MADSLEQAEFWIMVPDVAAGWARDMFKSMAEGLRSAGYNPVSVLSGDSPELMQQVNRKFSAKIDSREPFFVIDINFRINLVGLPPDIAPLQFSWVLDNPLHHFKRFGHATDRTVVGVPDHNHFDVYTALGIPGQLAFVPHAGHEPVQDPRPMAGRDIGLLFAGSVGMDPGSDDWHAQVNGFKAPFDQVINEATEQMLAEDAGSFQCLLSALERAGIGACGIEDLYQLHKVIESRAETIWRWQMLSGLKGLDLHIIGELTESAARKLASFATLHEYTTFDAMIDLVERTRILINATPKLSAGSHDRIWNGIAHGCLVATTPSRFLAGEFTIGEEMLFFPEAMEGAADLLGGLLADPAQLDASAASARRKYADKHTWRHRATLIAETMIERVS